MWEQVYQKADQVYKSLEDYREVFPEPFRLMYPYMKQQNWLYNYRNRLGIERSFAGVVRRSVHLTESDTAFKLFEDNYHRLQQYYTDFFPALQQYAYNTLQKM